MFFIKKIQKLQLDGIISAEIAQKIIENEKNKFQEILWKNLFRISAVLIGLGILMIIGANFENMFEIFYCLSYLALIGSSFCLYKSIVSNYKGWSELCSVLSFVLTGTILGLIRQKYQLDFAQLTFLLWCFIGLPYILLTRSYTLNVAWLLILTYGIPWENLFKTPFFQTLNSWAMTIIEKWQAPTLLFIFFTAFSALLCIAGTKLYSLIQQKVILPNAFAILMRCSMYIIVILCGITFNLDMDNFSISDLAFIYNEIIAQILVITFFISRLWLAYKHRNISALKRNSLFFELYIIYFFLSRLHNFFIGGLGLIIIGCVLLIALLVIRKIHHHFLNPLYSSLGESK